MDVAPRRTAPGSRQPTYLQPALRVQTDRPTILIPEFDSIILSYLFVVPDTGEPRLDEMSMEQLGDSPWLAWLVEVLNLAFLLTSRGKVSEVPPQLTDLTVR